MSQMFFVLGRLRAKLRLLHLFLLSLSFGAAWQPLASAGIGHLKFKFEDTWILYSLEMLISVMQRMPPQLRTQGKEQILTA